MVEINETNFPDENFRDWLWEQNYDEDGVITDDEIKEITSIDVSFQKINSLKGIEYFTALTELDCDWNPLTFLDVSKNTALTILRCSFNQLTTLNVSNNTALTILRCSSNQLTALDVSNNTALTELDCGGNQLTALDVSKNTALTILRCSFNQLTTLNVSKNKALTTLWCSENQLTTLDVSKNKALNFLCCSSNQLTGLDVSKNTALTVLYCSSNQIRGKAMDALINSLPQNETDNTYELGVYDERDDGNICMKAQVAAVEAKGWTPYSTTNNIKWEKYECTCIEINEKDFPDKKFRNWLLSQSYCKDGVLDIKKVTSINVSGKGISSLKGIEYFTELKHLYCYFNQLTDLNVSKNTALICLECHNNQLLELDVSKNIALIRLECHNNQLLELDVSKNKALRDLQCYANHIKGKAMNALINSLPHNAFKLLVYNMNPHLPKTIFKLLIYYGDNDGNVCTKLQATAAKAKGWTPYYYNNDDWIEYEGSAD